MLLTFMEISDSLATTCHTYLSLWIIWRLENALFLASCKKTHLQKPAAWFASSEKKPRRTEYLRESYKLIGNRDRLEENLSSCSKVIWKKIGWHLPFCFSLLQFEIGAKHFGACSVSTPSAQVLPLTWKHEFFSSLLLSAQVSIAIKSHFLKFNQEEHNPSMRSDLFSKNLYIKQFKEQDR